MRTPRLTRLVLLVALIGPATLVATAAPEAARPSTPSSASAALATTVGVIESELTQLADGRTKLKGALGGVAACTVSPPAALRQLVAVIANRTGISQQLRSLPAPTAAAARVKALLENALDHSLAADRHYRDWLVHLQRQPRCSTAANPDLLAAQREDVLATAAKQTFVASFNPLARQLHLATWAATRI
jgi:hypothetical protein